MKSLLNDARLGLGLLLVGCASATDDTGTLTSSAGNGSGTNLTNGSGAAHNASSSAPKTGALDPVSPVNNVTSPTPASQPGIAPIAIPKKGGITLSVGTNGEVQVLCGKVPCACNDGIDNDGDGTIDGFDAECTGPFDADEGSFATGIPGDNRDPKWQDCFFDGNSGAGDDRCRYPTGCLDGTLSMNDAACAVAQQCVNNCAPLAPPGCDCFGCCDVRVNGKSHSILVSDSCSTEKIDDPQACQACVQNTSCQNECGECELCLGKTLADLPAQCFTTPTPPSTSEIPQTPPADGPDGGETEMLLPPVPSSPPPTSNAPPPANSCDGGAQACSTSAECGRSSYCALGCCRAYVQVL